MQGSNETFINLKPEAMKNKLKHLAAVAIIAGAWLPLSGQTDTITKPGRPFKDPKITEDNSKVLIDTSERMENLVDSLLEDDNNVNDGKSRHHHPTAPVETKKDKMVKQPADRTRVSKP